MTNPKFVVYKRLSKKKQSGGQHGFESQQMDIDFYLQGLGDHEIVGEYQEYISGGSPVRIMLDEAIALCVSTGAILLCAKLDRISRKVSTIALLMERKDVRFKVASLPDADNFQLHLFSALAEQERVMIGQRVKRGLAAAKAKGVLLGASAPAYSRNPANATTKNKNAAIARTGAVSEQIKLIAASVSQVTYKKIAHILTKQNIMLPSGVQGTWKSSQVSRIVERFSINIYN